MYLQKIINPRETPPSRREASLQRGFYQIYFIAYQREKDVSMREKKEEA
jgi:hypothetical protein